MKSLLDPVWVTCVCLLLSLPVLGTGQEGEPKAEDPGPNQSSSSKDGIQKDPMTIVHREDEVVVTASRGEESVSDSVSLVATVDGEQISQSGSLVLDDALRQIPGFSLFRRNSSLTAHPTTQGVSLRGIGPSGTSRSLVLLDGVPLNDPFGGWVYWNRVPMSSISRVEVVRGATSQLYGSSALGGVIQVLTREPGDGNFSGSISGGSYSTFDLDATYGGTASSVKYLVGGRLFDTDGFYVIDPSLRGSIDRPVSLSFGTFLGKLDFGKAHVGLNYYSEDRGNGTALQTNSSNLVLLNGGYRGSNWQANGYYQGGVLESQFSRILPGRSQEFPTAFQRYESSAVGGALEWNPVGDLLVGSDWRRVSWDNESQNLWGAFTQLRLPLQPRLDLQLGGRFDVWENRTAQGTFSPKAGILFRASDRIAIRSSAYRGFRAPTLNELYRPFRVGNVQTLANPALGAEALWGGEGGFDLYPSGGTVVRVNYFWNRLDNPVGNVTLSVSDNLILRQRRNIGPATVHGVESEALWQLSSNWFLEGAYLFSSTRVEETGTWIPQVPRHQASASLRYQGVVTVSLQGRAASSAFEDDLNDFRMGGYGLVGFFVSRKLVNGLDIFVAGENVLDKRYLTGRVPDERLGEPRILSGGLRLNFNRR
jgi:outer membrane cobalamin receptor